MATPRRPRATSTDASHPWAGLVSERGVDALLAEGDGVLPAIARLDRGRYLLKAGRVGGSEGSPGSAPITAELITAVLDAEAAGRVEWETDPDFGYEVAASVPGVEPPDDGILLPRLLYTRADRVYEHAATVPRVRAEVRELIGG
jgi:ATP-dependent phosphoenolpyruvate carboxykinase